MRALRDRTWRSIPSEDSLTKAMSDRCPMFSAIQCEPKFIWSPFCRGCDHDQSYILCRYKEKSQYIGVFCEPVPIPKRPCCVGFSTLEKPGGSSYAKCQRAFRWLTFGDLPREYVDWGATISRLDKQGPTFASSSVQAAPIAVYLECAQLLGRTTETHFAKRPSEHSRLTQPPLNTCPYQNPISHRQAVQPALIRCKIMLIRRKIMLTQIINDLGNGF